MQVEVYDTYFQSLNIRLEKIGSENNFIWQIGSHSVFSKGNFTLLQHNIIMISKFTICTCIDIFIDIFIHALPIACRCCQSKKTLEGVNIAIFGSNMIWKSYYIHVHLYDIFFRSWIFSTIFSTILNALLLNQKKNFFVHVFSSFKIL